ncbi:hypothetical protein BLNAU_14254 [Blattamonas nauphoetae]|uniref:Uncharacterized protein n=1 Tax=Blattamonas nauphoetae TaxID=2049346 RepID=A0ABQ9XFV2_9EUKA|nr:hypothetical protein BLNAU_14254 [Blattamonas nauphoetae]
MGSSPPSSQHIHCPLQPLLHPPLTRPYKPHTQPHIPHRPRFKQPQQSFHHSLPTQPNHSHSHPPFPKSQEASSLHLAATQDTDPPQNQRSLKVMRLISDQHRSVRPALPALPRTARTPETWTILQIQPQLDVSLEAKAVKVLESVDLDDYDSTDAFLNSFASRSDDSLMNFIQSIGVLLSCAKQMISTAAMKMLGNLFWSCSANINRRLLAEVKQACSEVR